MIELQYTLLADGSSDKVLIDVLDWLLYQHLPKVAIQSRFSRLWDLPVPPKNLTDKIEQCLFLYPCDLLFVHRDAEAEAPEVRIREISNAINALPQSMIVPPIVPVVPVRMQEAWMLFDEAAIRSAAGNPNSSLVLRLPRSKDIEELSDPKKDLYNLLEEASGLHGRRKRQLNVPSLPYRVSQLIDDFSPLRELSAFQQLEIRLQQVIQEQGW